MELSDLTAYAEEKYHIREQHKWADFPGFSVLCHPGTGKWAALLMRQWDTDRGEEIQSCDLKCGQDCLAELKKTYLSRPIRMHGSNWINIMFGAETEPEVVFSLFDRAVEKEDKNSALIVLGSSLPPETKNPSGSSVYHDTPLPLKPSSKEAYAKEAYTKRTSPKETYA